ncbi:GlgS family glycogen synthesis protein [Buttiauxella ferragutiae ATCC 51602]|uniref:GlgS family glycogen synthesis protein n=2 Tax=Enterobacteriaceae TaxID=543 RepID=A0ABX2WEM3_9ENTR|nr:GlgS family glycogen synthesis protein [Buttiauxella ferragutiae ATCC 51602]TDN50522.1 glycogen synthesis protein [Buttiauxella sp. JUb87]
MKRDLQAVNNFDFLARSFARMYALGQVVDIQAVTGNMSTDQQAWFRKRYEQYCQQATRARELELEH